MFNFVYSVLKAFAKADVTQDEYVCGSLLIRGRKNDSVRT
jgi:hypothetical protein